MCKMGKKKKGEMWVMEGEIGLRKKTYDKGKDAIKIIFKKMASVHESFKNEKKYN